MNFKNLKIGQKLGLGFGMLIVLTFILGLIATLNMRKVTKQSEYLAKEYVPEVELANQIERYSLQTMYNMRGYGYTEEEAFLKQGNVTLGKVNESLSKASELANKSTQLEVLKEKVGVTQNEVGQYEKLVQKTTEINGDLAKLRTQMDDAAAAYMANCSNFLDNQNARAYNEISNNSIKNDRLRKITLINDIIDVGNAVRVANFKSQATRDPVLFEEALGMFGDMNNYFDEILTYTKVAADIQAVKNTQQAANDYHKAMDDFLTHWKEREQVNVDRNKVAQSVLGNAEGVAIAGIEHTQKIANNAAEMLNRSSLVVIIGLMIALVLGVIFAMVITRAITVPVAKGLVFARKLSEGDLTTSIDVDQTDEVGQLAGALAGMLTQLKDIVINIISGSDNIANASQQMSSSAQQVSQGATEQASSSEEVSSSMEEMAANIDQNTENALQTEKISLNAAKGIEKVNAAANKSLNSIKEIAEKITIINDIAFQTNILALNAAVEAARAGEHGKGFAVVAAEVRKLAERSKVAADEIDVLSKSSVQVTEESGKLMLEIMPEIEKTAKLVQEISAASQEQKSGSDQVNVAIQQLNQVTQQNAAASEEMATGAEELSSQAEQLRELISFFKIENVASGVRKAVGQKQKFNEPAKSQQQNSNNDVNKKGALLAEYKETDAGSNEDFINY